MIVKCNSNWQPLLGNDFWDDTFFPILGNRLQQTPAVNIIEENSGFKIEVAAPGMAKEDFKVDVEKNVLEISASKTAGQETENSRYLRHEFSYNEFKRSFTMSNSVDVEKITAIYKDGVLTVSIPRREEARVNSKKQIDVA
jgi:HSP20 family protein